MECKYDDLFTEIAGRCGGLDPFLSAFFGFLHRKTDFYVEVNPIIDGSYEKTEQGFPHGVAERMIVAAMKKYKFKDYHTMKKQLSPLPSPSTSPATTPSKAASHSTTDKSHNKATTQSTTTSDASNVPCTTPSKASSHSAPSSSSKLPVSLLKLTEEGKQVPIGNGGIGPNYYWNQTLVDISVYVDVPINCRGKDITCTIQPHHLLLKYIDETLIDGDFEIGEAVKTSESIWTINISTTIAQVVITLDKARPTWWKHVIHGHSEIDTTKVDSSSKMDDYDEKTQGAIRKILFDQKQSAMGLQTSQEIEQEALLEKIKYLPGSPFLPPPAPSP